MNLIIIISSLILFVTTTSKANEDNVEIHLADNLKRLTKNVLPKPGVFSKKSSTSQRLNYNSKLFQNSVIKHSTRTIEKLKNRLAQERSLHLLQHAKNPVEWYLWGEEAFEKARKEKKLIFVSIGYYICQGCHLMEEESFNNPDIAAVMNEHCVNIKVDGDERPDVLKAYIKTVDEIPSVLGNWPLNLFLTPELKPVLSGSYYPPADENGRPGFKSILMDLEKKWKSDPESMIQKSSELLISIRKRYPTNFNIPHSNKSIIMKPNPKTTWKRAFTHLERVYDLNWGGFYLAPKYPMVPVLGFLFYSSTKILSPKSKGSLGMALATLQKIDRGGIHDHVGQGFARYSRDIFWHVPHFEKRLSDQAQLAVSYTTAYLITKENHYADVVHDILHYVSRDLSHQDGGFYTAEDADSLPTAKSTKKKPGAYYTWTYEEVNSLLNKPLRFAPTITLSKLFCYHFSIIPTGNVPISSDPQEEFLDQNILIEYRSKEDTAKKFGLSLKAVKYELEKGKNILFEARNKRPRPLLDNKIITSLNGLMISAYAKAASALYIEEYKERAVQAAMFIKKHAWNPRTNTLLRLCYVDKNGAIVNKEQPIEGFLNDYAFLINGLFDLYECTLDSDLLHWIDQLQQRQDELFWDELTYAYYFSSDRDPRILLKFKGDHDGSMPTGNSVATLNLLKMAMITEKAWETSLNNLFQSYVGRFFNNPSSIPTMVTSLNLRYDKMLAVFITGKKGDTQFESLVQVIRDRYSPTIFLIYADNTSVSKLARSLSKSEKGRAAAYLCRNLICNSRIRDPNKLTNLLDAMRR